MRTAFGSSEEKGRVTAVLLCFDRIATATARGESDRMTNYTLTDLLLLSTSAILVNFIIVYIHLLFCIKNWDCMSLDAGDSRCHGRLFQ